MLRTIVLGLTSFFVLMGTLLCQEKTSDGWIDLFNGKDLTGWKLHWPNPAPLTKYVDERGSVIPGAKEAMLEQQTVVVDAKGKAIPGAKVAKVGGKDLPVDAADKPIAGARLTKVGGRKAIVDAGGKELPHARKVQEPLPATGGWTVENGEYRFGEVGKPERAPGQPSRGCDIYTERKFTDFELHVEFRVSGNGGVFLQGRYEIQVSNAFGHKAKIFKIIEKDGKRIETLDPHHCGGIVANIGPTKNMAKRPTEWQTYDVVFHGARGEKGKVTRKARVTVVWNGEKVIDNAEIDNLNNRPLDRNATEPGPILLQGLFAGVAYRNVRIKPLPAE
jgi:hypothetical protein